MQYHDFLFEIGTEELPAHLLKTLGKGLAENIKRALNKEELAFTHIHYYATPRRLAIFIKDLQAQQTDRAIERRGPALQAAYDQNHQPTSALTGFLRSCHIDISRLETLTTPQGSWLVYRYTEKGKSIAELMPTLIEKAITELPIAKPMRWATGDHQFVRPVQWVLMLYGHQVITSHLFGLTASNITYGHRFLHPQAILIKQPDEYIAALEKTGFVIADFAQRRAIIHQQIQEMAAKKQGTAIIDETLLDEVTGIVEWPVALSVDFDKTFLTLPKEVLITAMQHHQKSFPVLNKAKQLLPMFITISNIVSQQPAAVIQGNARVMRARLSDAKFFYENDCKIKSTERLNKLKNSIFQVKLGSLYDKSLRISQLANDLAAFLTIDAKQAARTGLLCKNDLTSQMVNEFPELQGIMGDYYARHDQEPEAIAIAIREHYLPRFSGDALPETPLGCALALADRLDTLVGIFGIQQQPTGDKDPFGLRRSALGIIRIIIEKQYHLPLLDVLAKAQTAYGDKLINTEKNLTQEILLFLLQRLKAWYAEQNIASTIFTSVARKQLDDLFDFHQRILAVHHFIQLPAAQALIAANKRVSNILQKTTDVDLTENFSVDCLKEDAEIALAKAMKAKIAELIPLYEKKAYTPILIALADLQAPIDQFFEKVMVNVDNQTIRRNRLQLLAALQKLFSEVAVIAEL